MKKMCVMILLCMSAAYAQEWLDPSFGLDLAFAPRYQKAGIVQEDKYFTEFQRLNVGMDVEFLLFDHLFIGGRMDVPCVSITDEHQKERGGLFKPLALGSTFDVGFRTGYLIMGYTHFCEHTIHAGDEKNISLRNETYDQVYLRLEF